MSLLSKHLSPSKSNHHQHHFSKRNLSCQRRRKSIDQKKVRFDVCVCVVLHHFPKFVYIHIVWTLPFEIALDKKRLFK